MKKSILILLVITFILNCKTPVVNDIVIPDDVTLDSENWKLTFSDEFNGAAGAPDSKKWERQEYNRRPSDSNSDGWWEEDNARLDGNGNLDITINKVANRNSNEDSDPHDYEVGMVRSKGKFSQTYGKFEARLKLPAKSGWWVAFWLFPDNGTGSVAEADGSGIDGTEIDILEGFGNGNTNIQSALHYDGYPSQNTGEQHVLENPEEFHTYTLIWTKSKYEFFVDGVSVWTFTGSYMKPIRDENWQVIDEVPMNPGISSVPSYVKLTGEILIEDWALANTWAGPLPNDDFADPDHFLVDWIRVYQYEE